jgi:hypothetical protein
MRATKRPVRQEYQVAIDERIPRYLPFSGSPNRKKGWSLYKDLGEGGYCRAVANETINITDIISLLGMVKAFQDFPAKVKKSDVEFGGEIIRMASLSMKLNEFLRRYIKHHNKQEVINTLTRLLTYKVIWQGQNVDGKKGELNITHFLRDFKISEAESEITFLITEGLLNYCHSNGWLINFEKIQKLKSNTAQILALHFSIQKGGQYRQETLEVAADLHSASTDNRKILKKALHELQVQHFIGEYTIVKDRKGYQYTIEHCPEHSQIPTKPLPVEKPKVTTITDKNG